MKLDNLVHTVQTFEEYYDLLNSIPKRLESLFIDYLTDGKGTTALPDCLAVSSGPVSADGNPWLSSSLLVQVRSKHIKKELVLEYDVLCDSFDGGVHTKVRFQNVEHPFSRRPDNTNDVLFSAFSQALQEDF